MEYINNGGENASVQGVPGHPPPKAICHTQ